MLGEGLPPAGGARVLDLGAACAENFGYFAPRCRTYAIADLRLPLRLGAELWPHPLPRPGTAPPFDLILAWDLLNYLSADDLAQLAELFKGLSRPGTRLFGLVYTSADMPARPARFGIAGPTSLRYGGLTGARRPSPRYKEPELVRILDGFAVERVFLLRHGVGEYVFAFGDRPAAPMAPSATRRTSRHWPVRRGM